MPTDGLFVPGDRGITFASIIEQAEDFEEISELYRGVGKTEKADRYKLLGERFRKLAAVFGEDKPQVQE